MCIMSCRSWKHQTERGIDLHAIDQLVHLLLPNAGNDLNFMAHRCRHITDEMGRKHIKNL